MAWPKVGATTTTPKEREAAPSTPGMASTAVRFKNEVQERTASVADRQGAADHGGEARDVEVHAGAHPTTPSCEVRAAAASSSRSAAESSRPCPARMLPAL